MNLLLPNQTQPVDEETERQDFRDHLTTADKDGHRQWLFPRKPQGRFYTARTIISWVLLTIMFLGPFIRIRGNPLLLLNFIERKFIIFGQIFWPQDMIISAVTLLIFFTGIIIFTAAFGRLWCGWTCPQTVLMEMVFRKIEYTIEGNSMAQRKLAKASWNTEKIVKKSAKHLIFFALSFLIGNTLLSYIIGSDQLIKIISDNPADHIHGLFFMVIFTLIFYGIFARFREQACTFICPYGRLQSTLLDENSIVVAYDHKRGEKRAILHRTQTTAQRSALGFGDCIDCHQCVSVCPTGIDIRNGTQMECVHCTACMDACDAVMQKVGKSRGLIRYASLNGIERGERLRFTPRLASYGSVLIALIILWFALVFTRSDVEATLLRAQGALFQKMPDGRFSNLYTIKFLNKTHKDIPIQLKLENPEGDLRVMGRETVAPAEKLSQTSVLIELDKTQITGPKTQIVVGVYAGNRRLQTLKTSFIGPRND